jgi:hypothetical protein
MSEDEYEVKLTGLELNFIKLCMATWNQYERDNNPEYEKVMNAVLTKINPITDSFRHHGGIEEK